jgi:hypothetical protein|tara:strand:- start:160 stop:324 length:165 start_codon:yes stop_codon:yes gene_type:complete
MSDINKKEYNDEVEIEVEESESRLILLFKYAYPLLALGIVTSFILALLLPILST